MSLTSKNSRKSLYRKVSLPFLGQSYKDRLLNYRHSFGEAANKHDKDVIQLKVVSMCEDLQLSANEQRQALIFVFGGNES